MHWPASFLHSLEAIGVRVLRFYLQDQVNGPQYWEGSR